VKTNRLTIRADEVFLFKGQRKLQSVIGGGAWRSGLAAASILAVSFSLPVCAQQADRGTPVVVQPGAPGQPTRTLPPSTRATLPPSSAKDVEFMQGMIMHHAQAVEMTALDGIAYGKTRISGC